MADDDRDVFELLDRAAAGQVDDPNIDELIARGVVKRQRRQLAVICGVMALVAAIIVPTALVVGDSTSHQQTTANPPTDLPTQPLSGPTAQQIADGKWLNVAAPPIPICGPSEQVWDGSELLVVDVGTCRGAAAYNPKTNTWRLLNLPPSTVSSDFDPAWSGPIDAVWSGHSLIVLSRLSGAVASLAPDTGTWQALPSLPKGSSYSPVLAVDDGQVFAIAAGGPENADVRVLDGERWQTAPRLAIRPPSHHYAHLEIDGAAAGVVGGQLYAVVAVSWATHDGSTATTELLRLDSDGWHELRRPSNGFPLTPYSLQGFGSQLVVVGYGCPIDGSCPLGVGTEAVTLRPGSRRARFVNDPNQRIYPSFQPVFTGRTVVEYYVSHGENRSNARHTDSVEIYDVGSRRWIAGPGTPAKINDVLSETWTPYGLVVLGQPLEKCVCSLGGLILKPAGR